MRELELGNTETLIRALNKDWGEADETIKGWGAKRMRKLEAWQQRVVGEVLEVRLCRCGSCVSEHGRPVNWKRSRDAVETAETGRVWYDVWSSEFGTVLY